MGGRGTAGRALPVSNQSNLTGLAGRLEDTYQSLSTSPNYEEWVSITDVRAKLDDVGRAELDAEMLRLLDAGIVHIAPNADQQRLTPADRAAALVIGGKPKHLIKFVHPEDRD